LKGVKGKLISSSIKKALVEFPFVAKKYLTQ